MRIIITILLLLFLIPLIHSQENIYIDEKGDTISRTSFQNKFHKNNSFSIWQYYGTDEKRYVTIKEDLYLKGKFDFEIIKKKLEILTNKKIQDSCKILLEYFFKDDLCTSSRDNIWKKNEIIKRKHFVKPMRDDMTEKGIAYFVLFEDGMIIKNNPKKKREYFYSDKDNFFKNKLFKNPTSCGSFAIIKPNGETLVRNGEYRPDLMAEHLKSEIWKDFFSEGN